MAESVDPVHSTEHLWTVKDRDGITHRAVRQHAGTLLYVITACPWWQTHNVRGEKAPVRIHEVPTCFACVVYDLEKAAKPS